MVSPALHWCEPSQAFCSLQRLMTVCFTAIRLIWKYATFLEKMTQNYRVERWKRFIKLVGPSSCQSLAVRTVNTLGSAPAMFSECLVMCCWPLPLRVCHSQHHPMSGALRWLCKLHLGSALLTNHCSSSFIHISEQYKHTQKIFLLFGREGIE